MKIERDERTFWQAIQVWPHLIFSQPAGPAKMLVGEPPQTRLAAARWALTLGQNFPKKNRWGTAQNCSPTDRKMWRVVSIIGAGHINILPQQRSMLKTLANRVFFRSKCSHINHAFLLLRQQKNIGVRISNNTKLTFKVQRLP